MIVYKFRQGDRVFDGAIEMPDAPTIPPYHTRTPPPEKEGFYAVMRNGWTLVEGPIPTEPKPEPDYAALVRAERNVRLSATDWTQLADVPVDRDAWATYRQALRELPTQEDFPNNVVWPTLPT